MGFLFVKMVGDDETQRVRFRTLRDARLAAGLLNASSRSNVVFAIATRRPWL